MADIYYVKEVPRPRIYVMNEEPGMRVFNPETGEWRDITDDARAQEIIDQAHNGDVEGPFTEPPEGLPTTESAKAE